MAEDFLLACKIKWDLMTPLIMTIVFKEEETLLHIAPELDVKLRQKR